MNSNAYTVFQENRKEIATLWQLHAELSGVSGPGRREDRLNVLNRAAIVFVSACWESYIEDVVREGFDHIVNQATQADQVPIKVRMKAISHILEAQDKREVWQIADGKWKPILRARKEQLISEWLGSFHSPKSDNVDHLILETLGISSVSTSWNWQKMKATSARAKLDDYITMRGNIAHRLAHTTKIAKAHAIDFLDHVAVLVEKTDSRLRASLGNVLGTNPW